MVGVAMEQQDSRGDSRRGIGRADHIDLEVPLLLGERKRAIDHAAREEARGTARTRGSPARLLERDCGAERCADQDDRPACRLIDQAPEILLLEEPVGARVAARVAVRAAVVGDDVEAV